MIYITELTTTIPRQFPTDWGERPNGGPKAQMLATLKSTKQKYSSIFQVSDILHTGTENKHDIICIYHPYHTK